VAGSETEEEFKSVQELSYKAMHGIKSGMLPLEVASCTTESLCEIDPCLDQGKHSQHQFLFLRLDPREQIERP
jgi:hypothetical protein